MPLLAGAHLLAGMAGDAAEIVEVSSTGVDLAYDVTEIRAKPGDTITIRFTNAGDMAHNIVLLKGEDDIDVVGNASFQAHANDWIPEDETDRIIAHTKVAGPGEVVEMTFVVPPSGTYPYICTYSGHWTAMRGRLISAEDPVGAAYEGDAATLPRGS